MSFARRNTILPRVTGPGVALIILVAAALLIRVFFPGAFASLLAPVAKTSSAASSFVSGAGAWFSSPGTLKQELDTARAQNDALTAENRSLAGQLADVKALLGSRTEAPRGILARVLARLPESPYDTLLIDQGTNAGVSAHETVYGAEGVPIGTITETLPASSRAVLYSAAGTETAANAGVARVPITLIGLGGGAFYATVPKDAGVAVGDTVSHAGLAVGSVVRVDAETSSPSATLRIQSLVNPFSLTWVTIAP